MLMVASAAIIYHASSVAFPLIGSLSISSSTTGSLSVLFVFVSPALSDCLFIQNQVSHTMRMIATETNKGTNTTTIGNYIGDTPFVVSVVAKILFEAGYTMEAMLMRMA